MRNTPNISNYSIKKVIPSINESGSHISRQKKRKRTHDSMYTFTPAKKGYYKNVTHGYKYQRTMLVKICYQKTRSNYSAALPLRARVRCYCLFDCGVVIARAFLPQIFLGRTFIGSITSHFHTKLKYAHGHWFPRLKEYFAELSIYKNKYMARNKTSIRLRKSIVKPLKQTCVQYKNTLQGSSSNFVFSCT